MSKQYGADGFVPTVEAHSYQGDTLVLHTTDEREATDLVSEKGEPLERVGDTYDEETKERLALREEQ
jgi:hypothetical protein